MRSAALPPDKIEGTPCSLSDLPDLSILNIFGFLTLRESAQVALCAKQFRDLHRFVRASAVVPLDQEPPVFHDAVRPGEDILAAYARCPRDGSILLHAGTHNIANELHLNNPRKGVRLYGRGAATLVLVLQPIPHDPIPVCCVRSNATLVINGIHVRNHHTNGIVVDNGILHVVNCDIEAAHTALRIFGPVQTVVRNTALRGLQGMVLGFGLSQVTIEGNQVQNCIRTGIIMRTMEPDITIRGNHIRGCSVGVRYDTDCPATYDLMANNAFSNNVVDVIDLRAVD